TTVAEIAKRAGLTERTFFRYFSDKREVLFSGSRELERELSLALSRTPHSLSPIDAVGWALTAIAPLLPIRREVSRRRQAVISANPELQERERIKLASLAGTLAAGLRHRGVKEPAASLAAEMGVTVFRIGFERWASEALDRDLAYYMRESMDELKALTTGTSSN
ncbi:MAG TPA: TetR family transcriptional regulator, partial [Candidatus Baltobacteraceae bacterium]|nr:TetR family transcriptional regulator [Candidatus Baltobacteraceae bacterium]